MARRPGTGGLLLVGAPLAAFALAFAVTLAVLERRDDDPPAASTDAAREEARPPVAAPEGRLVLSLVSGPDGSSSLWSVLPDGTDLHRLTEPPPGASLVTDESPALSPDAGWVAFTREVSDPQAGRPPRVYVLHRGYAEPRRLTRGPATELQPAWAPDGRLIAFARELDGRTAIFVAERDGSGFRLLVRDTDADLDGPAWSPDGARLAFTRFDGTSEDVYVADVSGGPMRLVAGGSGHESSPAWSPDGRRIAFVRDADVYVADADGSGVVQVTSGKEEDAGPGWSEDGSLLVFTREGGEVLVVRSDGTGLARVPLTGRAYGAVWEPGS